MAITLSDKQKRALSLISREIATAMEWSSLIKKFPYKRIVIDPILDNNDEKVNKKPLTITQDDITEKFMICYLFIWQLLFDTRDSTVHVKELNNYLQNLPVDSQTGWSMKFIIDGKEHGFSYVKLKKTTTLMRNNGLAHYGKYEEISLDNFDIYQICGFDCLTQRWIKENDINLLHPLSQ